MARRRQKERIESLKEGKEEERKGQVLNTERERERERESHMCKKDCFYKTTIVWPCGRLGGAAYQQSFRLFNFSTM